MIKRDWGHNKPAKCFIVFGTRPEAIKFAPVISEIKKYSDEMGSVISEILTSRNFNCNLFSCEDQLHPGAGVNI